MAGKPAYIATNLIPAADLSASSNLSGTYPIGYIQDEILGSTARFIGGGGAIVAHLTASPFVNYDSLFIGNHNVTVSGSNGFYLNAGNSNPAGATIHPTFRTHNTFYDLTAIGVSSGLPQNKPYFYIGLVASGIDPIEIGECIIGPRVLFPRAQFIYPPPGKETVNTGVTVESIGGQPWPYEFSKYKVLTVNFFFPESEYQSFEDFSDAVGQDPFVYIPDITTTEAYYVRKDRGFHPRPRGRYTDGSSIATWWDVTFTFRTESEGLSV